MIIEEREDLVIKGLGKATELKVANKVQELIASDAASGQKNVIVADGSSFNMGQHVCVRDARASGEDNMVENIYLHFLLRELVKLFFLWIPQEGDANHCANC